MVCGEVCPQSRLSPSGFFYLERGGQNMMPTQELVSKLVSEFKVYERTLF